jgi:hypothetical protein
MVHWTFPTPLEIKEALSCLGGVAACYQRTGGVTKRLVTLRGDDDG